MLLIVGLGNPGNEYAHTRHNIGWNILERVVDTHNLPQLIKSSAYNALLSEGMLNGQEITVLFPLGFMNNSGVSLAKYLGKTNDVSNVVVVHDEVDLPFGDVRVSFGRGASGHNGVQSIIDALNTKEFARIRVGVGKKNIFGLLKRPRGEALSQFVLSSFSPSEVTKLVEITEKVDRALVLLLEKGVTSAMQNINAQDTP